MKLYLIRHAETIENANGIIMGHNQGKLSTDGKLQAKKIARKLKDTHFDAIYVSDLQRAIDTAREIQHFHKDIPLFLTHFLREVDFGNFTGKHKYDVDWNNYPDGGEGLDDVQERSKTFFTEIYKRHPSENIAWITHNGFIKAFIAFLQAKDPTYQNELDNQFPTALNIFEIDSDHTSILCVNNNDHLRS